MKLNYSMDSEGKKQYTLEENSETKPAHYKYVKIRDAPKSDVNIVRRDFKKKKN